MKKTTINDAIKILEAAKKEFGGEAIFCTFNMAGDKEYPTGWDHINGFKGNEEFEEVYLT